MSESGYNANVLIGVAIIGLLIGAGLGFGGSQIATSDEGGVSGKLKVGFIYVGPTGDIGWTAAHDKARMILDEKYDWLETNFVADVTEGQEGPFIDNLINDWGADVIFTTSFGFMDGTIAKGLEYPDTIFFHISGFKRAKNVGTVFADFYQLYFLNGLMAGALTQTDQIGYVAAFELPELIRHINAFQLGARFINPDVTTHVTWINSWFDPTSARNAATSLVGAEDVDVLAFTEDTAAVVEYAEETANVYAFSHYSPMQVLGPTSTISGQLVKWEVLYESIIQKIFLGEYTNENLENVDILGLLKEDAVQLGGSFDEVINSEFKTRLEAVTVDDPLLGTINVWDLVLARIDEMSDTNVRFEPFTGPIYDQDGVLRLADGERMSIGDLLSILWFIGVEGGCTTANDVGCVVS
ncbi:MAG: BMP family ABC transporter substrate-binding protein [Candidatus Heimdallarchaeota archaeon]|nr:BMP family ABC transporter substrate-binding protein [Candidatus Heimdallarchaeota archaeon]